VAVRDVIIFIIVIAGVLAIIFLLAAIGVSLFSLTR